MNLESQIISISDDRLTESLVMVCVMNTHPMSGDDIGMQILSYNGVEIPEDHDISQTILFRYWQRVKYAIRTRVRNGFLTQVKRQIPGRGRIIHYCLNPDKISCFSKS